MARFLHDGDRFGGMDPNDVDAYFHRKLELEEAEVRGNLPEKLAQLGLSSSEEWWRIEASFYRRHFGDARDDEGHRRYAEERARRESLRWLPLPHGE